jgi:hypothetical protein
MRDGRMTKLQLFIKFHVLVSQDAKKAAEHAKALLLTVHTEEDRFLLGTLIETATAIQEKSDAVVAQLKLGIIDRVAFYRLAEYQKNQSEFASAAREAFALFESGEKPS